jgi:hypothetical protein
VLGKAVGRCWVTSWEAVGRCRVTSWEVQGNQLGGAG